MSRRHRGLLLGALATSVVLVASACAEEGTSGGSSSGGGPSVPHGASIEEWHAAFENIDPITINSQSPAPQGSEVSQPYEAYFERVEEYSNGKVTFDIAWADSVASGVEIDDAVRDGRLDAGSILPVYEPDVYPANTVLNSMSFYGSQQPAVKPVMQHAAMNSVALNSGQVVEELEENGLKVLLPYFGGDSVGVLCTDEVGEGADLAGQQIAASGEVNVAELNGIGATPVSIPHNELYEALQRGTVDCALTSMRITELMGLAPVAPHFTLDQDVGFGMITASWVHNKDVFESYPLAVQQLLYDSTSVLFEENLQTIPKFQAAGFTNLLAEGGSISQLDDEERIEITEVHESVIEGLKSEPNVQNAPELVDLIMSSADEWDEKVVDMGFPVDISYEEFVEWYEAEGYNLTEYMDVVTKDVFAEHRPS